MTDNQHSALSSAIVEYFDSLSAREQAFIYTNFRDVEDLIDRAIRPFMLVRQTPVDPRALDAFAEYFAANYPPSTIISDPRWHAPKVYRAALRTLPAPFQERVQPWLLECFGPMIAGDREERNHRFTEEALELVQARGMTASEAHQLVDYVFGRPVGEPFQEVGGVMVTLAALCLANDLDMHAAGETELARISAPETVAKIRAKQAAKPKHSPLPEHTPAQSIADTASLTYQDGYKDAWAEPCPNCGHVKGQELDNGEPHERG